MNKYCNEWVDIPNKFDKINIDTYKFSISEAKEKHKSSVSESSSITDRTLTIIKVFIPLSSFTIGYMLKSQGANCLMPIYIALSVALLIIGFLILKSKKICEYGQKPDEFFLDYLDEEENTEIEKEKSLYYNTLIVYNHMISQVNRVNEKRIKMYNYLISLISAISIFSIIYISYSI